jgi:hypothetical protein
MRIVAIVLGSVFSSWLTFFLFAIIIGGYGDPLILARMGVAISLSVMGTVARYTDRAKLSAVLFALVFLALYLAAPNRPTWVVVALVVAVVCFFAPMKGRTGLAKMPI